MGKNLDRMKAATAKPAEQPAIAVPSVTVPEKRPSLDYSKIAPKKKPKPPKPKHVLRGRLPHGSNFSGTYTHVGVEGEFDGYWDAVLTVPGASFTVRASGWFSACVKLDRMYRESLEVKS